jgi:hypothetical protein
MDTERPHAIASSGPNKNPPVIASDEVDSVVIYRLFLSPLPLAGMSALLCRSAPTITSH